MSDNITNSTDTEDKKNEKKTARIEAKRRRLAQNQAENTGGSGRRRRSGGALPFRVKFRIGLVLLSLIFAVGSIVSISDYLSKRPDYRVTDEGFTHAEKFADAVPLTGIDISEHQSTDIKWKKVKSSGIDFVFIRAGYRGADTGSLHIDSSFETNLKAARKAGLMVGVYFYSQALDAKEGKEEADFVLELLKSKDITLPVVIDYEIYPGGRLEEKINAGEMYAASFYHDAVLGFCREVEAAGYESAVYANKDMLTNYMQADLLDDSALGPLEFVLGRDSVGLIPLEVNEVSEEFAILDLDVLDLDVGSLDGLTVLNRSLVYGCVIDLFKQFYPAYKLGLNDKIL